MAFAVLCGFGVQWMSRKTDVREDSAIALFWTLGMSIGIIFSFLTPGFMTDLPSFLFGNILTIGRADLWLLGVLAIGVDRKSHTSELQSRQYLVCRLLLEKKNLNIAAS